jgi:hypothetical protein
MLNLLSFLFLIMVVDALLILIFCTIMSSLCFCPLALHGDLQVDFMRFIKFSIG